MQKLSHSPQIKTQLLLDNLFRWVTRFFAFLVLALLVGILISLLIGALPSIHAFGFKFLVTSDWGRLMSSSARWCPSSAPWPPLSSPC